MRGFRDRLDGLRVLLVLGGDTVLTIAAIVLALWASGYLGALPPWG